ncbi:hypothetical protein B0H14DRAFT_3525414 [Mycena olivaceomarginata]|nr:hypothetical protein B0H14DRAFT_3525414 [Mycena olivaceomarginata]
MSSNLQRGISSNILSHTHSSPCPTRYKSFRIPNPGPTPYGEITENWYYTLTCTVDASFRLKQRKQGYKAKEKEAKHAKL